MSFTSAISRISKIRRVLLPSVIEGSENALLRLKEEITRVDPFLGISLRVVRSRSYVVMYPVLSETRYREAEKELTEAERKRLRSLRGYCPWFHFYYPAFRRRAREMLARLRVEGSTLRMILTQFIYTGRFKNHVLEILKGSI